MNTVQGFAGRGEPGVRIGLYKHPDDIQSWRIHGTYYGDYTSVILAALPYHQTPGACRGRPRVRGQAPGLGARRRGARLTLAEHTDESNRESLTEGVTADHSAIAV